MTQDEMLKIKDYLEKIAFVNHLAKEELVEEWKVVYKIIYDALNGN